MANDAATCVIGEDNAPPQEGDTTICMGCGEILVFNTIGATEKMNKETFDLFSEEQQKTLLGIQKMVRGRK